MRRWARLFPAAYFAGVTLLFAWPMLLGKSTSAVPGFQATLWPWRGVVDTSPTAALQVDGAASSFPWSVSFHEALRNFQLPYWDWHSFTGGYDLINDGVSGVLYPLHLILWWAFKPVVAHDVYVVVHLCAGGLLMYALLRHWRLPAAAAMVGGTAWMLAPFNTGWMQAEMLTPVLITVPLAFWAMSAVMAEPTWRRVFGASAAMTLAVVAGNIVVFLVLIWVVGLYGLGELIANLVRRRPWAEVRPRLLGLVGVGIGSLALSAFSLMPTVINLLSLGRRASHIEEVAPIQAPASAFFWKLWNEPVIGGAGSLFELSWCGRVVLVLAVLGLLHRGAKRGLSLGLVLFFTLLPASPWLLQVGWYLLPPLRAVSGFGRLTFLASFGLAILAAAGTAVLIASIDRLLLRLRALRGRHESLSQLAAPVLAVLVIAELLPFAVSINPPWTERRPHSFFPTTAVHEALSPPADEWPPLLLPLTPPTSDPAAPPHYSFWATTSHIGSIDSVGGYDSAVPLRASALSRVMEGTPPVTALEPFSTAYLPSFGTQWARLDLARRVGVTHVYAPPGTTLEDIAYPEAHAQLRETYGGREGTVWELRDPLRGPRLVPEAVFTRTPLEALELFTSAQHDPERTVVLEVGPGKRPPTTPDSRDKLADEPIGRITEAERGSDRAEVTVVADRAGWLVLPIGFSRGWRVQLDGESVGARPADVAMTAVRIPPGEHTVTLTYRATGLRGGSLISLMTVLFFTGIILVQVVRRRRETPA